MPCLISLIIFILLTSSTCVIALQHTEDGSGSGSSENDGGVHHAFVQTGTELHYFRDVWHQEIMLSSISKSGEKFETPKKTPKGLSIFESTITDFDSSVIGVPVGRTLSVHNPTASKITLLAITNGASDFHCSFFSAKTLESKQQATFDVYFMPSREGVVEDTLMVHSSIGKFSHRLRGHVDGNPYRISPVHVTLPLNSTFSAPLTLHNAHPSIMRVLEVLSSDASMQVELPHSAVYKKSAPNTQWVMKPYATQTIGQLRIMGNAECNGTAFVQIRATVGDSPAKRVQLFIPIEFEVTRRRGIYSTMSLLDFGLLRDGHRSAQQILSVYSNIDKGVEVDSVYVADSTDSSTHGIYLQLASKTPIPVKGGGRSGQPGEPVEIVYVSIDSSYLLKEAGERSGGLYKYKGAIIAESRGGNYNLSIPYEVQIYKGNVLHDSEDTTFHQKLRPPIMRTVQMTNKFPFGLAIWDVKLAKGGQEFFEVSLVSDSDVVVLSPGQKAPVLLVSYVKSRPLNFTTTCTIYTNVSSFKISILIFSGELQLRLHSLAQRSFDFGALNAGERRSIIFSLRNPNPTPITIRSINRPFEPYSVISLKGIIPTNKSNALLKGRLIKKKWIPGTELALPALHTALFNFSLMAPISINESKVADVLEVVSNFQSFKMPATYQFINQSIFSVQPSIIFEDSFIGTVKAASIKIYSQFEEDLPVLRISIINGDPRFYLPIAVEGERAGAGAGAGAGNGTRPIIKAGRVSTIGRLIFAPEEICVSNMDECYAGIPLSSSDGQWFIYGMKLPQNLAEIDSYLYHRLRRRWEALSKMVRTSVVIDTPCVKNFEIPVKGQLVWPRLLSHSVVHFPLTAVGNFSIVNLTLSNPSTHPIIVQILPLVIYPDAEALLEFFRGEFPSPLTEPVETNETLLFSLRDTELFTLKPGSPVPKLREEVEQVVGSPVPRFTLSLILRPGMRTKVRVGFLPSDYNLRSSLLLIRNNLTGIEPIVLYGRGTQIKMEIDNRTARGDEPLLFDIQSSHLSDCYNQKRLLHKLPTTLTVKRSFVVKNTGEVSFSVVNMSISNIPCENRGYRILNCLPFQLAPGETNILDIAYTPDFLMSVNEAHLQLYMHMNSTPWVFDLVTSIPKHMLSMCHKALPRPPFEVIMYYGCIFALIFCLVCVVSCSYLEGDRIITCIIRQQTIQDRRIFDLNAVELTSSSIKGATVKGMAVRKKPSFAMAKRKLRNKNYLRIASDAGPVARRVGQFANYILWLVSHVWLMVRSDYMMDDYSDDDQLLEREEGANEKANKGVPPPKSKPKTRSQAYSTADEKAVQRPAKSRASSSSEKSLQLMSGKVARKEQRQGDAPTINQRTFGFSFSSASASSFVQPNLLGVVEEVVPVINTHSSPNSIQCPIDDQLSLPSSREADDGLSDTSAMPEWADSTPLMIADNHDEIFASMAENSAALFPNTDSENAPNSNPTPPPMESDFESLGGAPFSTSSSSPVFSSSTSASSSPAVDSAQPRTPRRRRRVGNAKVMKDMIGKMTREYRKRLEKALASGLPASEAELSMVADNYAPSARRDRWNLSEATRPEGGSSSTAALEQETSPTLFHNFPIAAAPPTMGPSTSQFGSLFGADPIWHPIFEDTWPSAFQQQPAQEEKKDKKD